MRRETGRVSGLLVACAVLWAGALHAQDTVQVIRPEARPDSSTRPALPPEVLKDVLAAWNDSAATRIVGSFFLPSGSQLRGPVAVFRGPIRVAGELIGRVTVINGDLIIDPGALVRGEILVVGGRVIQRSGARVEGGPPRIYPQIAEVERTSAGTLVVRTPGPTLTELGSASRTFRTGRFGTTVSIEAGRYNRVEGLPLVFGPTVVREGLPNLDGRLDLRAIAWTAPDRTNRRADFGYSAGLQFRFGAARRLSTRVQVYRTINATESQPLSAMEAGWSAFLFQRDYRDYYQAQGVSGQIGLTLGGGLSITTSVRRDAETSVGAGDPISVFRNESWRPNPLADDGHYVSWRFGAELDTRNDPGGPTSGWRVRGWLERSHSNDAAPLSLPSEVRDPIAPGRYAFSSFWLDARRYDRFSPSVRTSARLIAGGWLSGDPLPVQRRMSLGGPDILPGYPFRSQNCVPAALADPARSGLCDRLVALQLEIRSRTRVGLPIPSPDPYLTGLQRLFAIREPDIVLLANGGKAWVTGEGPGRVPNNKLPVLHEWQFDVGLGVDAGGLGFYVVQPLSGGLPLTFTVRLQRRF